MTIRSVVLSIVASRQNPDRTGLMVLRLIVERRCRRNVPPRGAAMLVSESFSEPRNTIFWTVCCAEYGTTDRLHWLVDVGDAGFGRIKEELWHAIHWLDA